MKVLSRRGMTVRRSLDLLSKQLDSIQSERNELKNTLSEKEKEICDLLKCVKCNRHNKFTGLHVAVTILYHFSFVATRIISYMIVIKARMIMSSLQIYSLALVHIISVNV